MRTRQLLVCVLLLATAGVVGSLPFHPGDGVTAAAAPTVPERAERSVLGRVPAVRVNGTLYRPEGTVSPPPVVRARAWAVADLETGRLLGIHRAVAELPMASTIKLLNAVTAARTVARFPDHRVTWREAHPEYCSCAGLVVGRRYTREALLAGMLLPSGNDAAEAMAGSHPRGRAAFLRAMNATAASLGADHTNAATPSGLTAPGGYSSARDLLLLLRAAQATPAVERILSLARYELGPRFGRTHTITRRTDFVNEYVDRWPGLQGKSGFTTPAKNTLVVNVPIRGRHIGVAILGAPDGTITPAAKRLTLWAADNFRRLGDVGVLPEP
ncbi:MAG TPA: serine hydrolase [Nocardioidaceae bacterium]|nr:serine hydrolase [Nocardioidaceae bacterium]